MRRFRQRGLDFSRSYKRTVDTEQIGRVVKWCVQIIVVVLLAFLLVFFFGLRISISDHSMDPVLKQGDKVLVNRLAYRVSVPKKGDVVVYAPNGSGKNPYSVKRVVAGPTDTVQIEEGYLYVNGEACEDEDGENIMIANAGVADSKIRVGENEYFVLGDNPDSSEDSRFANVGNISIDDMEGKVYLIVSPMSDFGRLDPQKAVPLEEE